MVSTRKARAAPKAIPSPNPARLNFTRWGLEGAKGRLGGSIMVKR